MFYSLWYHEPISEHAPVLQYSHTKVYCNVYYNIGAPAF